MSCVLCISFASRATTLTRPETVRSNNSGHRPQPIREWYQSLVLYNGTAASKACLHSGSDDLSPSPGHHSARYSVFCLFPPLWSPVRGKAFFTPFLSLPFSLLTKHSAELHLRTNPPDYAAQTVEEVLKDHPLHFTFNRK